MILPITMKDKQYDVVIKQNALKEIEQHLDLNKKVLILTDSGVPTKYSQMIAEKAKEAYIYTIPQGEASKSFENFEKILDYLIEHSFSRTDAIVACGGGVVGDLAGFVASTYMRGITFYNVPTTLLSQVDSSIGGKTAIDKNGVKNIVGAFYAPSKVVIDKEVLTTLDKRQLHSGLVEVIKMASTSNKELFNFIKNSKDLFEDLETIIIEALKIKKEVVELDPEEKNIRKILNFGHTIGHAIESSGMLKDILHGEAVGIGMLYMSGDEVKNEIYSLLKKYDLPTGNNLSKEQLFKYITLDKKRSGDYISIIRVEEIGKYEIKKILLNDIFEYL